MHEVYMGQNIIQDKNITFQVLYTLKQSNPEDANYCSVVTKLTYENKSFLFMGDGGYQDGDVEPALLKMKLNLKSDVLKVGQEVEAKVIDFNEEAKRISLSMRELEPEVAAEEAEVTEE